MPRGARAWGATIGAILLFALTLVIGVCMTFPVPWDGLGKLGAAALAYPLHILFITATATVLAVISRVRRVRLALWLYAASAGLSAIMAILPAHMQWARAGHRGVTVSMWQYVHYAAHANIGNPQHDLSVTYGTSPNGWILELDVWRSGLGETGPLRPAMILLHGGAWTHGHRSLTPDWDRWLNSLGYEVFDVAYRLPTAAQERDEVGDVKSALGWVADHAAEYHVDPRRISVMGVSAGGNLAMLAAYTAGDTLLAPSTNVPIVQPRTVIGLYAPVELTRLYDSTASPAYLRANLRQYIGGSPSEMRDRYRALSPLSWLSPRSPPTLAFFGTSDRIVPEAQAVLLAAAMKTSSVAGEVIMLPTADHGFDTNWGSFATQLARARIQAFLAQYDPSTD